MTEALIGRTDELTRVQAMMQATLDGKGHAFSVSGEAGIGKSTFVNDVKHMAEHNGFSVLSGRCTHRTMPFEPFFQVLSDYSKEVILGSENFISIDTVFLITKSGLLAHHVSNTESEMDEDILSGMLTAVQDFVGDSFGDETDTGGLGRLEYKNTKVLIEHGKDIYIAAIITADEHEDMKKHIASVLSNIIKQYGDRLKNWTGNVSELDGIEVPLSSLIDRRYAIQKDFTDLDMDREKLKLYDRVLTTLQQKAMDRPLLIILEDIHHGDELTLQALHYIARNIKQSPIFLAFTYRTEDVAGGLEETIDNMVQEELHEEITLSGLGKGQISELLKNRVGVSMPPNVLDEFFSVAGGNPLYAIEYAEKVLSEMEPPVHEIIELPPISSTPSLASLMSERLLTLNEEELYLAERLATIGHEFDDELIAHCFGEKKSINIPERVDNLISKRVLKRDISEMSYEFNNSIIQQVLYDGLGPRWRSLHHLRVGGALEEIHSDDLDQVIYELANHFLETNAVGKAITYASMAGSKAQEVFANEDAITYYEGALDVSKRYGGVSETDQAMMREKIGDVKTILGQYSDAENMFEDCLDLYPSGEDHFRIQWKRGIIWSRSGEHKKAISQAENIINNKEEVSNDVLSKAYLLRGAARKDTGSYMDAIEDFKEAERMSIAQNDLAGRAKSLGQLGNVYQHLRDWEVAIEHFNKNIEISLKAKNLNQLVFGYNGLGVVYKEAGNLKESLEYFLKCKEVVEKIGDVYGIGGLYLNLGTAYRRTGDWDEAIRNMEKGLAINQRIGNKQGKANAFNNLGIIYDERGDWSKARELHSESLKIKNEIDDKYGQATSNNELGWITRKLGDISKAENHFKRCIEILDDIGNTTSKTYPLGALGDLYFDTGRTAEAKQSYEEALHIAEETDQTYEKGSAYGRLARTILKDDAGKAEEYLSQAIKIAGDIDDPYMTAEIMRYEGIIRREQGAIQDAIGSFTRSGGIFEELSSPFEIGRTKYELALTYVKDGQDPEARAHFKEALEIFKELGANLEIETTKVQLENQSR